MAKAPPQRKKKQKKNRRVRCFPIKPLPSWRVLAFDTSAITSRKRGAGGKSILTQIAIYFLGKSDNVLRGRRTGMSSINNLWYK